MSENHDQPIDLSALDPTEDRARFDRIVAAINAGAAEGLNARRARIDAVIVLAAWRRPMLAAAAVVAVISATILASVDAPEVDARLQTDGIAEALGVPTTIAQWIEGDELPSTSDLFTAFR